MYPHLNTINYIFAHWNLKITNIPNFYCKTNMPLCFNLINNNNNNHFPVSTIFFILLLFLINYQFTSNSKNLVIIFGDEHVFVNNNNHLANSRKLNSFNYWSSMRTSDTTSCNLLILILTGLWCYLSSYLATWI